MPRSDYDYFWFDETWNPFSGCQEDGPGCHDCYAAGYAVTHTHPRGGGIHASVAERSKSGRFRFNGKVDAEPPGHEKWAFPLHYRGAKYPKLGEGRPSLIFVGSMADLFYERRPPEIITKVLATVAMSKHIGLIQNRRTARKADYFGALDPRTVRKWQPRMWLGFSAEDQTRFDKRWPPMRALAQAGWTVYVNISPMIGPVLLPPDFLALGSWVIVSGEVRTKRARPMDHGWARAVRDQARTANIPFYLLQMTKHAWMPPDLCVREFPKLPDDEPNK